MKVELILVFILLLSVIFMAFRDHLPWPSLLALIAVVGFNPYFWQFKDQIGSDLPFLLFTYLSLYLMDRNDRLLLFYRIFSCTAIVAMPISSRLLSRLCGFPQLHKPSMPGAPSTSGLDNRPYQVHPPYRLAMEDHLWGRTKIHRNQRCCPGL
jgi:hypothetical protein